MDSKIREDMLHDIKRIAELMKLLIAAMDKLYFNISNSKVKRER